MAGVVIPIALILIIVISTIIYFRLRPEKYSKMKNQLSKTKRSISGAESEVDMENLSPQGQRF
jgi:hypothetical protein